MSSLRKKLGKLFLFAFLEVGALAGVPITPEQIEELLNLMNRTKVVHVLKTEDGNDP
ncbi:MAG: hypothetical protein ACTHQM_18710 [Thermoanaerobaculia bacterium]